MHIGQEKVMKDGTKAYLSASKSYFIRREPDEKKWTSIKYYTLKGVAIKLATGKCLSCGEKIASQHCGDYVGCSCGDSFVDTDRWFPERHRFGGNVRPA